MRRCRGIVFSGFERATFSLLLWHLVFGPLWTLPRSLHYLLLSAACVLIFGCLKRISFWDDGVLDMV